MSKTKQLFTLAMTVLLLLALPLSAQEQTAGVAGIVKDASGSVLPGVTVEINGPNLAGTATSVTDSRGRYRFPSLPPGPYTVTANLDGFQPSSVPNVRLQLGQSPNVDLTMNVGSVSEAIVVTGDAPLVDTTASSTAVSISGDALTKLPRDATSRRSSLRLPAPASTTVLVVSRSKVLQAQRTASSSMVSTPPIRSVDSPAKT